MSDARPHPESIGPYPLEREVGRGGMGIVYLARDPRLERPVAIKVLPDGFASDPDRLARFEREARLLAALSHPNIAAIYGIEESAGRRFLVLEYVEGETLAERLARGPLPVEDAVEVCGQVAAALEAAHESGIIHRDLKPGNIKLMPSGGVKVLDFGLAKGGGATSGSVSDLSASPTLTAAAATGAGVILGTAAYMSPEQARGRSLDRRTDIWSFGCVLYECLTGRQAFAGETVSDLIALILKGEPEWSALPPNTPPRLRELLVRCLTKDARKRLRDIGEARLLLEGGDAAQSSGVFAVAPAAASARPSRLGFALAGLFALSTLALGSLLVMRKPEALPIRRVSLKIPRQPNPPRDPVLVSFSPDGSTIASTTTDSTGSFRLWVRPLDALEVRYLPGTEDAAVSAWSPDGHSLVFTTQDKVKKIDLRGGMPETLCPVTSYGRGVSWGSRGVIVFSGGAEGPIYQVPQNGGASTPATVLEPGETGHRFPQFLPDGVHFIYAAMPPRAAVYTLWIGSTADPKRREKLMEADGVAIYVEPGRLLFSRNGRVLVQPFDAGTRRLSGEPVALPDAPKRTDFLGGSYVAAAARGPFAYFLPEAEATRLVWFDVGQTQVSALTLPTAAYTNVSLSPDAQQAAIIRRASQSESDLWLIDMHRMVQTRFTFGPGRVDRPVFSPDGSRIAFSADRSGRWDIFVKDVGGSGPGEALVENGSLLKYAHGWTPDGQTLMFEQIGEKTGWDIWEVSLQGDRKPRPLFATAADEQYASVSPNGRWIAYATNESGRIETIVDSYPQTGHRSQISPAGGDNPIWSADGRQLIYSVGTDSYAIVAIDPQTGRAVGEPRTYSLPKGYVSGEIAPDFRRFLALVEAPGKVTSDDITLVDNWRSALKRR